jgi:hypothetical protein
MVLVLERKYDKKKVDKLMGEFKPVKIFDAQKFAGKIEWNEAPLDYQKRIRNEWS